MFKNNVKLIFYKFTYIIAMNKRTKFPIGIQSFEQIRTEDYLYVDKTEHIYNLVNEGKVYFLSRPRRFGKSLLVSTLRALFQGNKELFSDLWIDRESDFEWKEHPVVVLDFNGIPHSTPDEMKMALIYTIEEYAEKNGIKLKSPLLAIKLKELILNLKEKTGQNVVVLVDEYDKPIIDFLGQGKEKLKYGIENREILRSFYGVLKEAEVAPALRFLLITGVSKFSKVSIFSELNNLYDLTMQEEASDLLGYTQEELRCCFENEICELAKKHNISDDETIEKLSNWYNGYRFSEKDVRVYNPFSILQVFRSLSFKNYWFESGSPRFLINLIREKEFSPTRMENIEVAEESFLTFEIESLKLEALLFQTGYLTINNISEGLFTLGYPNREVRNSLSRHLFAAFSEIDDSTERSKFLLLSKRLKENRYEDFFNVVKALYASIPHTLNSKRDEAYFHSIFYLMVSAAGIDSEIEVLTSKSRIDLVIKFKCLLYIIEFKCNQSAKSGIIQIKERKYYEKYLSSSKEIFLMGINFSTDKKNVVEWEIEKL